VVNCGPLWFCRHHRHQLISLLRDSSLKLDNLRCTFSSQHLSTLQCLKCAEDIFFDADRCRHLLCMVSTTKAAHRQRQFSCQHPQENKFCMNAHLSSIMEGSMMAAIMRRRQMAM